MTFYIQKLKISNFLSFLKEYEVYFEPFTGIICNYFEGKDDFFRSLEFVFGAELIDLRVENCLDLVHKVLREEFLLSGHDIHCFVKIILYFPNENKHLSFCRGIINRNGLARIAHKIENMASTQVQYEEKLNSLGLFIKRKNLIFYKDYFDNIVWNSSDNLEKIICNCLRVKYLAEEWKKAKQDVEYLTRLKNYEAEKNYNSIKNNHNLIAKYTDTYKNIRSNKKRFNKKILKSILESFSDDSSPSPSDQSQEVIESPGGDKKETYDLEMQYEYLKCKLHNLKLQEAELTSYGYYEEIKLAVKLMNKSIIQKRIKELKNAAKEKENKLSEIWRKLNETENDIQSISNRISITMILLKEIQTNVFLQDRFTKYGRFSDYLHPSPYLQVLKEIIGPDIFNAHLSDSLEMGFSALELLKGFDHRETFISFECYPTKLKDIIIASGEKGIEIKSIEELLIFLCKLKHYGFIEEVPTIIQKSFDFDSELPNYSIFYLPSGLFISEDGLITYKYESNVLHTETEADLRKTLQKLQTEEVKKYEELNELFFQKYATLCDLVSLDKDLNYFQQKRIYSNETQHSQEITFQVKDLYKEYSEVFNQYSQEYEKIKYDLQESEELTNRDKTDTTESTITTIKKSLQLIINSLENIEEQKEKIQNDLKICFAHLQEFYKEPFWNIKIRNRPFIFGVNLDRARIFFEKEFKKFKKTLSEDDFEIFMGVQEWRKITINFLLKDFEKVKKRLQKSIEIFQKVADERKRNIYPLMQYLTNCLPATFANLMNSELRPLELSWGFGEEKLYLMSLIEKNGTHVEIQNLSVYLRFVTVLSTFLEISVFEDIPIIIFDSFEDFFPLQLDDLENIFKETNETYYQNPKFNLLMKVGQFFKHYIKKNTTKEYNTDNSSITNHVRGPKQIIFLAKEDFIHSASHFIWIKSQVLPDELISEDCNSYSQLHVINLDIFN